MSDGGASKAVEDSSSNLAAKDAAIIPAAVAQHKRTSAEVNSTAAVEIPTSIVVPPLKIPNRPVKKVKLTPPSYSDLTDAVNNLQKSLKANPDGGGDIRDNSVFSVGYYVDQLYAQITEIKRWSDDVVRYKDKQYKDAALMRIPKASTDGAFQSSAKNWIPNALKLNGNGDVDNATRRIMKYFIKNNKEVVLAALEQEGISVLRQMNEEQIAAMMKDGKVKTQEGRASIMRHLRNHCGKGFLASKRKVETLLKKMNEEEEQAKKDKGDSEK